MNESPISTVEQSRVQLNEVKFELGRKIPTMMLIDTNNISEKVFCLIIVSLITLVTIVVSFNFRSQIHTNSTVIKIPNEETLVKAEVTLSGISPFNRFSYLQIKFRRTDGNSDFNLKVHFGFQILALNEELESNSNTNVNSAHPTNSNYIISQINNEILDVVFRKNNIESETITFFRDRTLFSNEYKLFLTLSSRYLNTFTYLKINWSYGDRTITLVLIIIRSVYLLIMILLFFTYTKLFFRYKFKVWLYEQKLTLLLIILCFFSNYPLDNIFVGDSSIMIMILSSIFNCIFQSFLLFYIISIFYCLKSQYESRAFRFSLLIASLFFIITIVDISFKILDFVNLVNAEIFPNNIYFRYVSMFCELFLILFTIIIIVFISASLDETEFSRFITYSVHTFLMLIVTFPSKILKNGLQFSYIASLIETTGYNLFVISMCYFHWTYVVMDNTSYQDSSIQEIKEDIMIDKFNEDEVVKNDNTEDS